MENNLIRAFWCGTVSLAFIGLCATPSHAQSGTEIFKGKCAVCHGPDAKGQGPMGKSLHVPDLTSPEVQKQSDAELADTITKGKNKMPAYGDKLSKEQIGQLVAYVRDLAKKK